MSKVSKELSTDHNRHQVGKLGGTRVSDINNKNSNRINPPHDIDKDNLPDGGVTKELSEDMNAQMNISSAKREGIFGE